MNQLQDKALSNIYNSTENIHPIGLLDMPPELLDIILSNIHVTKDMRLISKRFSNNLIIRHQAFSTFTLWPRVDCYQALDLIAHNPNLSPLVETIRVSNLPRLYRFRSLVDYADTCSDLDLSDPSAHSLWTTYRTWVEAETHFWEDGAIPRLNLQLLENLQAVEMAGAYHLQRETTEGKMIHRREEETHSSYHARSWKYGQGYHNNYYNNCHFATFARGSLSSLTTLKKLIVHKIQELMDVSETFELPGLDCLDIRMEMLMLWDSFDDDFSTSVAPTPWLLSLNSLTTLKLTQCPLAMDHSSFGLAYPDVIQLIKDIEFPNLREVRFETITTKPEALHRFLRRTNVKHIKKLSILNPALPQRKWACLRRVLEKAVPPYESLELSDAYSYDTKDEEEEDYFYSFLFKYAPRARMGDWDEGNIGASNSAGY